MTRTADTEFYLDVYKGTHTAAEINDYLVRADNILSAVCDKTAVPAALSDMYDLAVCTQADFMLAYGTFESGGASTGTIKSISLGDYSCTYADGSADRASSASAGASAGGAVSFTAMMYLERAGALERHISVY